MTTWTTVDANGLRFTHATEDEAERFAREHGGEVAVLGPTRAVAGPWSDYERGVVSEEPGEAT